MVNAMPRVACTLLAAVASLAAVTASAATPILCGPRDHIVGRLATGYHERPAATALTADGQLLEVLRSAGDSTWSILVTRPRGLSCIVAVGESWQERGIASDAAFPGSRPN